MEDKKKSCNGIITFEEAYRYQNHSMAKIIFTSRYIRIASRAGNLVKYMGTREGVENLPTGIDHSPSTKKQQT